MNKYIGKPLEINRVMAVGSKGYNHNIFVRASCKDLRPDNNLAWGYGVINIDNEYITRGIVFVLPDSYFSNGVDVICNYYMNDHTKNPSYADIFMKAGDPEDFDDFYKNELYPEVSRALKSIHNCERIIVPAVSHSYLEYDKNVVNSNFDFILPSETNDVIGRINRFWRMKWNRDIE